MNLEQLAGEMERIAAWAIPSDHQSERLSCLAAAAACKELHRWHLFSPQVGVTASDEILSSAWNATDAALAKCKPPVVKTDTSILTEGFIEPEGTYVQDGRPLVRDGITISVKDPPTSPIPPYDVKVTDAAGGDLCGHGIVHDSLHPREHCRSLAGRVVIRFDGPPSHESGRFVEVERDGKSIKFGEWMQDGGDGDWLLVLPEGC